MLEGAEGPEDLPREAEPARRAARGLSARREDQRDAHDAEARRRHRRARPRLCRQPDVPRHRSPHLQRLHEGVRLPEAGAGQHPADRDPRPHGGSRIPLGNGDLRAAHAVEPAQLERPHNSPTTGATSSWSASALPATRSRTTSRARGSASSRSTASSSSRSPSTSSGRGARRRRR